MKVKEKSETGHSKNEDHKKNFFLNEDHGIWSLSSWQIDVETMEAVTDFIFLGSKITADGNCSHEIKRGLLLGREAMINLDSILKSRDITLPTKVYTVKVVVFHPSSHVWM